MQFSNSRDHQKEVVFSGEQLGVSGKGWNVAPLKLRSNLQLLPKIRCLMIQEESSIINMDSNTKNKIIRKVNDVLKEKCRTKNRG